MPPEVNIAAGQAKLTSEGTDNFRMTAFFSDPGALDAEWVATVECYEVNGFKLMSDDVSIVMLSSEGEIPQRGRVEGICLYGDTSESGDPASGTFGVAVTVTDKDGGTGQASFDLTVRNVDPTPTISLDGTTDVGGSATFIGQIGVPMDFPGTVTDPGSDDLFLAWDWDDGSNAMGTYLADPPNADPFPSPAMDPRDIADFRTKTWAAACLYVISLTAIDDDGGEGMDQANVIIRGASGRARSSGYWLPLYRGNRSNAFDQATLECYLVIVAYVSEVFDEERDGTSSFQAAAAVLQVNGNRGTMSELLDEQLLGVWLNFANGGFGWDDLVDTTGNRVGDTPVLEAIQAAEAVRLDPDASREELEAAKNRLEAMNLMHGG